MPGYAKQYGAFLAILNLSSTPYDDACDLLIHGKAGEVMTHLLQMLD
jgi:NAD-dependent deacetylase